MNKHEKGNKLLSKLWDVRLFGGMVPEQAKVIGVIQCDWAVSLHPINIESTTITSAFSSSEDKNQGSFGRKHFVPYGIYCSSWTYSSNRSVEFKKLCGDGISINDMELFEESLKYGSSHGRSSSKGFIEPLMILKVVKDKGVRSRYDGLSDEVYCNLTSCGDGIVRSRDDLELKLNRLEKLLNSTDYLKVQVYVSESGKRNHKDLLKLSKRYKDLGSISDSDLNSSWEYVVLYELKHSNPNGDPEMDNMPRRYEGTDIGIISPERQKRWIRDYVEDLGEIIFVSRKGKVQKAKERLKEIENLL